MRDDAFNDLAQSFREHAAAVDPRLVDRLLVDHLGASLGCLAYVYDVRARRLVYTTRPLPSLLGYTEPALADLGEPDFVSFVHADDLARVEAHLECMAEAAGPTRADFEYRARDASGRFRWLRCRDSVLSRDAQARPLLLLGVLQDITEHVRVVGELEESRRALEKSEQHWRSIAENPFDFVIVIDRSYKYTYINFAAPGLDPAELIGNATPLDFTPPEDRDRVRGIYDFVFREGRATSYDAFVPGIDKWFRALVGPIREGDEVTHISILARDISHERQMQVQAQKADEQLRLMQAKLAQSAKLEALGQLAGGIAHDFNNLLTGIAGVAEVLQNQAFGAHPARDDIEELRQAVRRGTGLTRQLLTFSREQPIEKAVVDVNALLRETAKLLTHLTGPRVDLVLAPGPRALFVCCDRTQLEQVLMNLSVNARDAMAAGGRLAISLSEVELVAAELELQGDIEPGRFVRLTVEDDGCGMDEATLSRIFEPFFTTKPLGQGTGLGLATVYGIVRSAGGFVQVRSAAERGSTFEVFLPAVAAPPSSRRRPPSLEPPPRETVLLVEDDTLVLRLTSRLLEAFGYRVYAASRAEAALEQLEGGLEADLLISDVRLPGIDGPRLLERARLLRPNLPVLFISGYTDQLLSEESLTKSGAAFLHKPFTQEELTGKVRDALARARGPHARTFARAPGAAALPTLMPDDANDD